MLSDVVPWNAISQGTNRGAEEDGGNRNMEEVVAVIEGYHDKGNGDHTHKSRTHSHCVHTPVIIAMVSNFSQPQITEVVGHRT